MLHMDPEIKQLATIGTVVMGILVAGYIIRTERCAANADRDFTKWIHENGLHDCKEYFFDERVGYLDGLTHFNIAKSKAFKNVREPVREEAKNALTKLRKSKSLQMWLVASGIPETYMDGLKSMGVTSLKQLQGISQQSAKALTAADSSMQDYIKLTASLAKLQDHGNNLHSLETQMLNDHKAQYSDRPGTYSLLTFVSIVLSTGFVTGLTMFISRSQNYGTLYLNLSKKSLYFLTGHYDIAQNTRVTWNWEEPQTVGKTMTFNIRFFHKNRTPYPVSNTDNISVEITNGGSEVAKTMVLGGMNPEDANLAQVSFTVHKSGDYIIAVMLSSRHIKGSPFTKRFEAGNTILDDAVSVVDDDASSL